MSILTQHTMGVASLGNGEIEYMMARNIVNGTDDQGPWPLRQLQGAFSFPTWVMMGDSDEVESNRVISALRLENPLVVLHGDSKAEGKKFRALRRGAHAKGKASPKPMNDGVHLLSFHARQLPDDNEEYVVRVQNVVAGSGVKTVDLAVRFNNIRMNTLYNTSRLDMFERFRAVGLRVELCIVPGNDVVSSRGESH